MFTNKFKFGQIKICFRCSTLNQKKERYKILVVAGFAENAIELFNKQYQVVVQQAIDILDDWFATQDHPAGCLDPSARGAEFHHSASLNESESNQHPSGAKIHPEQRDVSLEFDECHDHFWHAWDQNLRAAEQLADALGDNLRERNAQEHFGEREGGLRKGEGRKRAGQREGLQVQGG